MKAAREAQVAIPGFEFQSQSFPFGIRHIGYAALAHAGVELILTDTGAEACRSDEELRLLIGQIGHSVAVADETLALEMPGSSHAGWAAAAMSGESTVYISAAGSVVVKDYDSGNDGARHQAPFMAWVADTLDMAYPPEHQGLRVRAPRPLAYITGRERSVLVSERTMLGPCMYDLLQSAQSFYPSGPRTQQLEQLVERVRSELLRVLGAEAFGLLNDINGGVNLFLDGDSYDIGPGSSISVVILDQPSTWPEQMPAVRSGMRQLQTRLESK